MGCHILILFNFPKIPLFFLHLLTIPFPIFQTKNYLRFIKLKIRVYLPTGRKIRVLYELNPRHQRSNYAAKPPRNLNRIPQRRWS